MARVPWEDNTIQDEDMLRHGFIVNTKWKLAICLGCKSGIGIDAGGLQKHLNHENKPRKVSREYCQSIIKRFGLLTRTKIKLPTSVIPAIFSLAITPDMYCCNRCGYAARAQKTLIKHYKDRVCPGSYLDIRCGPAQAFFPKTRCNFFAVRVPLARTPGPSEVPLSVLFKAQVTPIQTTPIITVPSNTRDMNHFLLIGDWFQEVNCLTGEEAYHITRKALPDLRPVVRQSVNSYVEAMNKELSGVDFAIKVAMGDYNQ